MFNKIPHIYYVIWDKIIICCLNMSLDDFGAIIVFNYYLDKCNLICVSTLTPTRVWRAMLSADMVGETTIGRFELSSPRPPVRPSWSYHRHA